jgi:hypothetical protein
MLDMGQALGDGLRARSPAGGMPASETQDVRPLLDSMLKPFILIAAVAACSPGPVRGSGHAAH